MAKAKKITSKSATKATKAKATKATKAKLLATTAPVAPVTPTPKPAPKGVDKFGYQNGSSRAWVAENCYSGQHSTQAQVIAALAAGPVAAGTFPKAFPHLNMLGVHLDNHKLWQKSTIMVCNPNNKWVKAYGIVARD